MWCCWVSKRGRSLRPWTPYVLYWGRRPLWSHSKMGWKRPRCWPTVPETRHLLERGMEEIYHVAHARAIPLSDNIVAQTMAVTDTITPSGTSSLQRDIVAGKRSELDAWIGAVVRLGAEAGVATPVHA